MMAIALQVLFLTALTAAVAWLVYLGMLSDRDA